MSYWTTIARAVGHWPLQDDALGSSIDAADGPTGILVGSAASSALSVPGPTGWLPKALSLDGATQHVATGMADGFLTEGTLAVWARPDTQQDDFSGLVVRRGALSLYISSDNRLRYNWSDRSSEFSLVGPAIPLGQWTHVAVRVRPDRVDFFVNGTLVSGNSLAHSAQSQAEEILLGVDLPSAERHFDGALAGAIVFSEALTDADVAELAAGPEPTLVGSPALNGTPGVGRLLRWSAGSWDSHANGTTAETAVLEWSGDGVDGWQELTSTIDQEMFVVSPELAGKALRVAVRAVNDGGDSETAYSELAFVEPPSWLAGQVIGSVRSGGLISGAARSPGGLQAGLVFSGEVIQDP